MGSIKDIADSVIVAVRQYVADAMASVNNRIDLLDRKFSSISVLPGADGKDGDKGQDGKDGRDGRDAVVDESVIRGMVDTHFEKISASFIDGLTDV